MAASRAGKLFFGALFVGTIILFNAYSLHSLKIQPTKTQRLLRRHQRLRKASRLLPSVLVPK